MQGNRQQGIDFCKIILQISQQQFSECRYIPELSPEFDRLDYIVYRKGVDEWCACLVKWRPLRLAYLTDYALRLRGDQDLSTTFAEDVIPRQDLLAVIADASAVCSLIAEHADSRDQNVFEPFHGAAVCAHRPPKSFRLFAPFACNNTLARPEGCTSWRARSVKDSIGRGIFRPSGIARAISEG